MQNVYDTLQYYLRVNYDNLKMFTVIFRAADKYST